jgi:hypothetical protein
MRKSVLLCTVLALLILGTELSAQTGDRPSSSPTGPMPSPAPVIVDGKILFYIKTGLLSFTAQDRAQAVTRAIKQAAGDFLVGAVRWVRIVLTVGLFTLYILLVLEFFPWTRGVSP